LDLITTLSELSTTDEGIGSVENKWSFAFIGASEVQKHLSPETILSLEEVSRIIKDASWSSDSAEKGAPNLAENITELSGRLDDTVSAYISTLLCGRVSLIHRVEDNILRAILEPDLPNNTIKPILAMLQWPESASEAGTYRQNFMKKVFEVLEPVMKRRRLFVTRDRHIGAAPMQAKKI